MIKLGNNNIGQIYLGSNSIGKAYLGSNLVFQKGSSPTPPTPVVGVPYIRGGANGSYIDTGITPDNTTRIIVWARNLNPASADNWFIGSRVSLNNSSFLISAISGADTGSIRFSFGSGSSVANNMWASLSGYHKYEINGNEFLIDDTVVSTATDVSFSSQYSIHLFGMNNGGTHIPSNLPIDICACKIYKNDVLVRDFTAVNSPSVGLYDAVSDTVFTTAGSGSFTYGTFNSDAYVPLEYIECTHSQYFDSGLYGTGVLPIIARFKTVGTDVNNPTVFGTMTSGEASSMFLLQLGNSSSINRYLWLYIDSTSALVLYNNRTTKLTNKVVTLVKGSASASIYENNEQIGSTVTISVDSSWSSPDTFAIGTTKFGGSMSSANAFNGYLYFFGVGSSKNFVPAKVNGVAGMYDTYNDVFKPSESGVAFVAGPEV